MLSLILAGIGGVLVLYVVWGLLFGLFRLVSGWADRETRERAPSKGGRETREPRSSDDPVEALVGAGAMALAVGMVGAPVAFVVALFTKSNGAPEFGVLLNIMVLTFFGVLVLQVLTASRDDHDR
ncbi:hypothetical protein [Roseospira goensis]|uniref:Uncharacterized protein n=1 Tax=Roseospira goensis TaxID=391922 RepID=A0A7W6S0Q3_9PROT|nr:hypothetical protein [Roseospira goensis]MBB4286761.1 hypothetical protein [Roseospira goensis]